MDLHSTDSEESPYSAMTLNERLVEAGLRTEFDQAAYANNESSMRSVLAKVDLGSEAADKIIEWVRTSPHSMYRNSHRRSKRLAVWVVLAIAVVTAILIFTRS